MTGVALLQLASGILLYLGYAWLTGALCSRICLRRDSSAPALASLQVLRRGEPAAAIACLLGVAMSLYAAAATMSGMPLMQAHHMFWMTCMNTSIGHNCQAAMVLSVLMLLTSLGRVKAWTDPVLAVLLALFAGCRAMSTHASEEGLLSLGFATEWIHLILIAVWLGVVTMSAWVIVPRFGSDARHRQARDAYLERLSTTATVALGGLVVTGVYNVVLRVGSIDNATGNPYASTLLVKVGLVLVALGIGAYNRFRGFPVTAATGTVPPSVLFLLRAESFILIGALGFAVLLGTMSPPAAT